MILDALCNMTVLLDRATAGSLTILCVFPSSQKLAEVGINVSLTLCFAILDLLYVCNDELIKETSVELAGASILVNWS